MNETARRILTSRQADHDLRNERLYEILYLFRGALGITDSALPADEESLMILLGEHAVEIALNAENLETTNARMIGDMTSLVLQNAMLEGELEEAKEVVESLLQPAASYPQAMQAAADAFARDAGCVLQTQGTEMVIKFPESSFDHGIESAINMYVNALFI